MTDPLAIARSAVNHLSGVGYTYSQIARLLGVTPSAVGNWASESCGISAAHLCALRALARSHGWPDPDDTHDVLFVRRDGCPDDELLEAHTRSLNARSALQAGRLADARRLMHLARLLLAGAAAEMEGVTP
ncbi:MAG: hypothetical protein KatS3mg042_0672 [Rhodothermaceae bacterium]|nr:MAG: hypothetical protein KatS3mg042_0672 [Rhodothermaceae bacterium]